MVAREKGWASIAATITLVGCEAVLGLACGPGGVERAGGGAEAGGTSNANVDAAIEAALGSTDADVATDAGPDVAGDAMAHDATADTHAPDAGDASIEGSADEGGLDASPDEGVACTPTGSGAVAAVGCPCTTPAALACAGNAQKVTLICDGGAWALHATCAAGQNCDSAVGANQGTCAAIDSACAGATAGTLACGSTTQVVVCDVDLVSTTPQTTCSGQTCLAGACSGTCTAGTVCASCSNGEQTTAGTCDDTGACQPGTVAPCGAYACGASACNTTCATRADCASGYFCWNAACVKVAEIAAGYYFTCALTTAGGVQCWGSNFNGQLGNDSTIGSYAPVAVTGLSSGVSAVAAGDAHTCALTTSGGVQCWGDNQYGQLGNNSTTESHVPVAVTGLSSGVSALAAGGDHTCALTTAGGVQCWGDNANGQLGNDSTTNSDVPVAVMGLSSGVSAIRPSPRACSTRAR
jgi:hypothetical protein